MRPKNNENTYYVLRHELSGETVIEGIFAKLVDATRELANLQSQQKAAVRRREQWYKGGYRPDAYDLDICDVEFSLFNTIYLKSRPLNLDEKVKLDTLVTPYLDDSVHVVLLSSWSAASSDDYDPYKFDYIPSAKSKKFRWKVCEALQNNACKYAIDIDNYMLYTLGNADLLMED